MSLGSFFNFWKHHIPIWKLTASLHIIALKETVVSFLLLPLLFLVVRQIRPYQICSFHFFSSADVILVSPIVETTSSTTCKYLVTIMVHMAKSSVYAFSSQRSSNYTSAALILFYLPSNDTIPSCILPLMYFHLFPDF